MPLKYTYLNQTKYNKNQAFKTQKLQIDDHKSLSIYSYTYLIF